MSETMIPCPTCPAYLSVLLVNATEHRLCCQDCGHVEPIPAAVEAARAGAERLPGFEREQQP